MLIGLNVSLLRQLFINQKAMKLFKILVMASFLVSGGFTYAQTGVSINSDGSDPDGSAILDVKSTSQGLLIPRMTETQRDGISSPATGLIIFQTDNTPDLYIYDGSNWKAAGFSSSVSGWTLNGTDVTTDKNVGIGTATPANELDVVGDAKIDGILYDPYDVNAFRPPHAYMRFSDVTETISLTQNTWAQITNATNDLFTVYELSGGFTSSDDKLSPPAIKGHYNIMFTIVIDGGTGNDYEVRVYTSNEGEISKITGSSGFFEGPTNITVPAYWETAGDGTDEVWFEIQNTTDNDDVVVSSAIVTIQYFHGID